MINYLVSTATLPKAIGHDFYDYEAIPDALKQLNVDGIELVFLPEWDPKNNLLTKTSKDIGIVKNKFKVNVINIKKIIGFILL